MSKLTMFYGIHGFFGNALSDAVQLIGHTEIESEETIKEESIAFVKEKTEWDPDTWDEWHPEGIADGRTQSAKFSETIKGRSPECPKLQNYRQFILIILDDPKNTIDELIEACSRNFPIII
ncbi:hypothetical protein F4Z99_04085 [Candidatus Poribacteria bacterium]|nr:hypothetical protein [Candidatus Poribacteria bacterium]